MSAWLAGQPGRSTKILVPSSVLVCLILSEAHSAAHRNTISIVKPTRCTDVSSLFYFGMTLYVFLMVFLSITSSSRLYIYIFFPVALQPNAGHGLLILEVSRSHTTTHHSR